MINIGHLHEVESIELRSLYPRSTSELLPAFLNLGFTLHDDLVSLDRTDKVPPWQHSSIVEIVVRHDDEEVFGFDEREWTSISLQYLFAALPYELSNKFIDVVFTVGSLLNTAVLYQGAAITKQELSEKFEAFCEELLIETGEDPGSERLAIIILGTYPRRQRT